mmetsp:Transcript_27388/g.40137  ORF Transcript_27388/g.40137 Transcript_27388/m.40137 type:complete len:202 (+) Transcript_27388:160-765(+)
MMELYSKRGKPIYNHTQTYSSVRPLSTSSHSCATTHGISICTIRHLSRRATVTRYLGSAIKDQILRRLLVTERDDSSQQWHVGKVCRNQPSHAGHFTWNGSIDCFITRQGEEFHLGQGAVFWRDRSLQLILFRIQIRQGHQISVNGRQGPDQLIAVHSQMFQRLDKSQCNWQFAIKAHGVQREFLKLLKEFHFRRNSTTKT